ncbi:MAG: hypothetical protein FH752_08295 [Marinobacter adhaerens]|uniref:Uncharacterized protein n=1 Tax=Marinobacter adhaerens TaxID=1033846 RepID=A0A844HWX7_9GAMM|nr:hypothetical protein [Marinobacter adhaerens]
MLSKRYIQVFAAALSTCAASYPVLSNPQIGSVSKSPDDPSKLIITGSGFSFKSHSKPLYFFSFEGNNLSQQEDASFVTGREEAKGTFNSEITPFGKGHSLQFKVIDDHTNTVLPGINFSSDRLYVYFNRRYNFSIGNESTWGPNGLNLKTTRIWGDDGNNIYVGYQGKEGSGSGRIYPEYTATGGSVWLGNRLPQVQNQWTQEEIIYKTSDIGVENGRFDLVRNGNYAHNSSFRMRTSSHDSRYSELYFDQISNGVNASEGLYIYYDNIYIDDSHHRVYISDSSQFSEAKKRLIQVPTKWNDTQIEIIFDNGDISESNSYLYVVDGDGNVNANGAKLCTENCPSPPNSPESLSVQ